MKFDNLPVYLENLARILYVDIINSRDARLHSSLETFDTQIEKLGSKEHNVKTDIVKHFVDFYFLIYDKSIEVSNSEIQRKISSRLSKLLKTHLKNIKNEVNPNIQLNKPVLYTNPAVFSGVFSKSYFGIYLCEVSMIPKKMKTTTIAWT